MAAAWEEAEQAGFSHPEPPRDEQAAPTPETLQALRNIPRSLGVRGILGSLSAGVCSGTLTDLGLNLGSAAH